MFQADLLGLLHTGKPAMLLACALRNMLALGLHAVLGSMQGLPHVQELAARTSAPSAQTPLILPEDGRTAGVDDGPPLPGILGMASQVSFESAP